jgi:hypothetical protein
MATLAVNVAVDKLENPDFSSTQKELKAWEVVRFNVGQGGTTVALSASRIGECNYVDDCKIDVPIAVTYMIASDLRDNIANAQDVAQRNDHRAILLRIETHARTHYSRVVEKVIPAWVSEIKTDLLKTLPTKLAPTSENEDEIRARITPLVDYWVGELGFRMAHDVNEWERLDYPQLEKFMGNLRGVSVFLPQGFPIPRFLLKPESRPKVTFPTCRPKKG